MIYSKFDNYQYVEMSPLKIDLPPATNSLIYDYLKSLPFLKEMEEYIKKKGRVYSFKFGSLDLDIDSEESCVGLLYEYPISIESRRIKSEETEEWDMCEECKEWQNFFFNQTVWDVRCSL